jgi:hypothetical protein
MKFFGCSKMELRNRALSGSARTTTVYRMRFLWTDGNGLQDYTESHPIIFTYVIVKTFHVVNTICLTYVSHSVALLVEALYCRQKGREIWSR